MGKSKTLCDLDRKDIEKSFKTIVKMVDSPKYLCIKCARAANKKEYICKPLEMKK
jgi:hypothetical protein